MGLTFNWSIWIWTTGLMVFIKEDMPLTFHGIASFSVETKWHVLTIYAVALPNCNQI